MYFRRSMGRPPPPRAHPLSYSLFAADGQLAILISGTGIVRARLRCRFLRVVLDDKSENEKSLWY